jgi:transposase
MHIMSNELPSARRTRREHTAAFKRDLVDRSLVAGASVSSIALEAGINANLLFAWRRQLLRSMAQSASPPALSTVLLPVTVERTEQPTAAPPSSPSRTNSGSIEIELGGARVRVRGHIAAEDLRSVLQALRSLA